MIIDDYFKMNWHLLFCHGIINGECGCRKAACVSPGKHPKGRNGVKDAISDRYLIMDIWRQNPRDNVAVRTGPESGIWVLDLDQEKDWEFDTLATQTGKGRHYFFKYPMDRTITNRSKLLGEKIDVRGINGYVIIPPSNHVNGNRYKVIQDRPIIEAPEWLLQIIN